MTTKEDLVRKINGMVLVSEANRKRLLQVVNQATKEEDLRIIADLVLEEEHIIEQIVTSVVEAELTPDDTTIIEVLDQALKKAKKEIQQTSKVQESEEKKTESEKAEDLLKNL